MVSRLLSKTSNPEDPIAKFASGNVPPSIAGVLELALAELSPELKTDLLVMTIFPNFFDIYALTHILMKDNTLIFNEIKELMALGLLEIEPVNRLYKRYYIHKSVKDFLMYQTNFTPEKAKELRLRYIQHYKSLATSVGWFYVRKLDFHKIAMQILEKELSNIEKMVQFLIEDLVK